MLFCSMTETRFSNRKKNSICMASSLSVQTGKIRVRGKGEREGKTGERGQANGIYFRLLGGMLYIAVPDMDAAAEKVKANGGSVVKEWKGILFFHLFYVIIFFVLFSSFSVTQAVRFFYV
jgi:hypothetical protein